MWKKLLFAGLLFVAVVFVTANALFGFTEPQGVSLTVPDFSGASEQQLAADDRFAVTAEYRYDESPAGTVLSQTPAAGTIRKLRTARDKCELRVVVSMGQEMLPVPDVIGQNAKVAAAELRRMGFLVKTESISSNAEPGAVVGILPEPGSDLPKGSVVRLLVSNGE